MTWLAEKNKTKSFWKFFQSKLTKMSKRKGEELPGPSRKKSTSLVGTSSRVSEDEEDDMDLTQNADFDINTVRVTSCV